MKPLLTCLLILLNAAVGCGDGEPGGTGGSGGHSLLARSSYNLGCTIDTLVLELPIDLSYELDRPYIAGESSELTFSAAVTFTEQTAATFIDAGVEEVDIISVQITTLVEGATPSMLETSFAAAPINDFDLEVDPDDDGLPGPHRFELNTQIITTQATDGAQEVELGLELDQVSLVLGDFEVPMDCLGPTLVGFPARFPVGPSG